VTSRLASLLLLALAACASTPAQAAAAPTLAQVRWAADYELAQDALATTSCSAGSNCYSREALGRVKVRSAACRPIEATLADCAYEFRCLEADDPDRDGWCTRTARFIFETTLDGKQRWQIARQD
jgi:hypothetical protein